MAAASPSPDSKPLPDLTVELSPTGILTRLEEAARRGRLAGFEAGEKGVLFKTCAFSSPFEGELLAHAESTDSGGTRLRFSTRMKKKLLYVFVVVLLVSIWPGMPITESVLASLVPSWRWLWATTVWWYLPLSVIGAPWSLWVAVKRSRQEMAVSAPEMVAKVEKELKTARTAVE